MTYVHNIHCQPGHQLKAKASTGTKYNVFILYLATSPLSSLVHRALTMGKATKALKEFINEILQSVLEALPTSAGTIYANGNFRLDMQVAKIPN